MLSQKNDACLLISVVAYRLLAVLFSFDSMTLYHHCLSLYGPCHAKTCLRTFADSQVTIILRIRAVWSGYSLSAKRFIGYYRMYKLRAHTRMIRCACTEWFETVHLAHVGRHFFVWRGLYVFHCEVSLIRWGRVPYLVLLVVVSRLLFYIIA